MKYIIFSYSLLLSISVIAQDQHIQFVQENLETALTKAKESNKIIFVDAYTTWCGPCKMMEKKVFTDPSVASFYNENFVNLKLDMEKGDGLTFAKKHSVRAYPSLLFINDDGELVHKSLGYQQADRFIELGKAALDPEQQVMTLMKRFEDGDRDQLYLSNYVEAMTIAGMNDYEIVTKAYLDQEKDWTTDNNIRFLFDYSEASMSSNLFQYMLKNKKVFEETIGTDKIEEKIEYAAQNDVRKEQIDASDKNALLTHFNKYFPKKSTTLAAVYYIDNLMYAPGDINQQKYLSEVQLFMATEPDLGSQSLNSHAWRIYELSEDRDLLQKASIWVQESISLESNSYNQDTYASLLYKLGDKKMAIKTAKLAIKLAQDEGNDATATIELLEKINKM